MWHIFKNKFKVLLRSGSLIFWNLAFPIILGTFFFLAFSNLTENEKFNSIDIGIVENENYQKEDNFKSLINNLSSDDNKIFNVTKDTEEVIKSKLESNEISGYYIVNNEIELVINKNGVSQTIMKTVIDNYSQTFGIINNIINYNPQLLTEEVINNINSDISHFKSNNPTNTDLTVIFFYSLIGMVCMFASFYGIEAVRESEANMSAIGKRVVVSPINKFKNLFGSILAGWVIEIFEVAIILFYLVGILKIDFGSQIIPIALLTVIGSFTGITFGAMVSSSNTLSENTKVGICLSITMIFSTLSGMMSSDILFLVKKYVPILSYINPVSLITDSLRALYCYSDLTAYWTNITYLSIFSVIMIILTFIFVRRKKYDSI